MENESQLVISEVIIGPGSEIEAKGLKIADKLSMSGDSILSAMEGDEVSVGKCKIVLTVVDKRFPSIVLGNGDKDVPSSINIEFVSSEFSKEEVKGLHRALISGSNWGNCENWREVGKIEKSEEFELECESGSGNSVLLGNGDTELVIRAKTNRTKVASWIIATAVGGGLLVIGVIIVCAARSTVGRGEKDKDGERAPLAVEPRPDPESASP
jgi:hypothetical protein